MRLNALYYYIQYIYIVQTPLRTPLRTPLSRGEFVVATAAATCVRLLKGVRRRCSQKVFAEGVHNGVRRGVRQHSNKYK